MGLLRPKMQIKYFFVFISNVILEMNKMKHILCPISNERINEHVTRINALFGILLLVTGFLTNSVLFLLFLMADFYIRAFTKLKFSPISYASQWLTNTLNLGEKSIDKAPKIFAARIGFLMTLVITVLFLLDFVTASFIFGGILVFFATLEFALAICMGCIMYTHLILPFYK
jgi:hypothetical protein